MLFAAGRRSLALVAAAALLVAPAACSDSTAPNGVLTPEETSELALQMGIHLSGEVPASAASTARSDVRLNAVPAPFKVSITNVEVDCPVGGTTRVSATVEGTMDEDTESLVADIDATQRLDNCAYEVHGKTFRLTGSLTTTAHVEVANGLPVGIHTVSVDGEFTWRASDGRRGTCTVSYDATANYTTKRAVVNGNFCGSTIAFDGPLTD